MTGAGDDQARELIEHSLLDHTLSERPAPELVRGARVAVYGAGNVGREVARLLASRGVVVGHFIDLRASERTEVDGVPIVSPAARHDASIPVVVGVFNRDADPAAIRSAMRASGASRIIDFVELHARFSPELGTRFWLVSQAELRSHARAMRDGLARWADDGSREHFARQSSYRLTGDPSLLPPPIAGIPYRPADLPTPPGAARLIDGGAFDGDTIRAWDEAGVPVAQYWGFEPDPGNFAALERFWRARAGAPIPHELLRAALGARAGTARFAGGSGEASRLGTDGGTEVSVCGLSEAIGSGSPSELKLDIEGAEPDALEGARDLIVRTRPRLAICAYHRCDHLWRMAEWIGALDAGYALYLRSHGQSGFDVVTYGLPNGAR